MRLIATFSSYVMPESLKSCLHLDKVQRVEQKSLVKCQLHQCRSSSSSHAAHKGPLLVCSIYFLMLTEAMQPCMLFQKGLFLL